MFLAKEVEFVLQVGLWACYLFLKDEWDFSVNLMVLPPLFVLTYSLSRKYLGRFLPKFTSVNCITSRKDSHPVSAGYLGLVPKSSLSKIFPWSSKGFCQVESQS